MDRNGLLRRERDKKERKRERERERGRMCEGLIDFNEK